MRLRKCMGWWASRPSSRGKWHCVLRTPFLFSFNGTLHAFVLVLTGAAWANTRLQTTNLQAWTIQLSRIVWAVVIICQEITAQLTALLIVSLQKCWYLLCFYTDWQSRSNVTAEGTALPRGSRYRWQQAESSRMTSGCRGKKKANYCILLSDNTVLKYHISCI